MYQSVDIDLLTKLYIGANTVLIILSLGLREHFAQNTKSCSIKCNFTIVTLILLYFICLGHRIVIHPVVHVWLREQIYIIVVIERGRSAIEKTRVRISIATVTKLGHFRSLTAAPPVHSAV